MAEVYLGLGSNLGDREKNIREGLRLVSQVSSHVTTSSIYETEPVGFLDQPRFLNAACQVRTRLEPLELLARLQGFEASLGRRRSFANAPRVLDLDILLYGQLVISSPMLTVPHPRLAERAFALAPLAEIAPSLVHPVLKESIVSLLGRLPVDPATMRRV